jgi:hypothetical protein
MNFMKIIALLILALTFNNSYSQKPMADSTKMRTAPWFVEKFKVTAGLFLPVSSTNLQVGLKGAAAGTEIDFEKDLALNNSQLTFLANFQWRISSRSRINLNYYNMPRSSTHSLQRDITYNGTTYPVDATVTSNFNTAIYQVSYGYAILAKPNFELGVLIGTHTVGANASIALTGSAGSASGSTDFGFTAPLPDLGIWGGYAFNKRMALNLDMNYLALTVGDVTGKIFAYNISFLYRLMDKVDLTLGYSGLNINVDVTKTTTEGHLKWGYNGPSLGVSYSFGKKSWR